MIQWQCKSFSQLSNLELYQMLQLRNEVFVVEQNCPYQDCDNKDIAAFHLMAYEEDQLLAYSRLLNSGISYDDATSIGRVLTSPKARRQLLGKELMKRSIETIYELFGKQPIKLGGQLYLQSFYESFGFNTISEVYLEDGIPHITMQKHPTGL